MAKFKAAGKKAKATPKPGAVPCVILVVLAMVFLSLMLYLVLKSA